MALSNHSQQLKSDYTNFTDHHYQCNNKANIFPVESDSLPIEADSKPVSDQRNTVEENTPVDDYWCELEVCVTIRLIFPLLKATLCQPRQIQNL